MPSPHVIPIFPLSSVVFPGERALFHIFEDRFKAMLSHCLAGGSRGVHPFGVTCVLDDRRCNVGCLVEVERVLEQYEDGRQDIQTLGRIRYQLVEVVRDGAYPQAKVVFFDDHRDALDEALLARVVTLQVKLIEETMGQTRMPPSDDPYPSFTLAHSIGLSLAERQQLLEMRSENERLTFLLAHLRRVLPQVGRDQELRTAILANGHMKNVTPRDI